MIDPLHTKRQENIAAYVISMWHIEDLMRASNFDLEKVNELLVSPMDADEEVRDEVREWYANIIESMKEQGIEERGHLADVTSIVDDLEFLNRSLLDVVKDEEYDRLYSLAAPGITAIQQQSEEGADGPIETCFTAIYGVMILKAQGKEVSEGTLEAESHMRALLEGLSDHYKQMRKLPGISLN